MTLYYVRKSGDDGTGSGTSAAPWLTINKALNTVTIGGGHTILVGGGTYNENSGANYLLLNKLYSDWVTVQPESSSDTVIITDNGSDTYTVRVYNCSYIEFKNIQFVDQSWKTAGLLAMTNDAKHHIKFTNCTIAFRGSAGQDSWGVYYYTGAVVAQYITLENVVVSQIDANPSYGVMFKRYNAGGTLDNVTLTNCQVDIPNKALILEGVANFLVNGGFFRSTAAGKIAVLAGNDSAAALATTSGILQNFIARSELSHAAMVGFNCDSITVQDAMITGGDLGLTFKECSNNYAYRNKLFDIAGSNAALYFKAAVGCEAKYNTIVTLGTGIKMSKGDTDTKCQNLVVTHNKVRALGTGRLMYWSGDADDLGGCVIDYNQYRLAPGGKYGYVRGTDNIATLAALKAVWAAYDDGSNDSHSRKAAKPLYMR